VCTLREGQETRERERERERRAVRLFASRGTKRFEYFKRILEQEVLERRESLRICVSSGNRKSFKYLIIVKCADKEKHH
jgi:hypothetical protein